MRPSPRSRRSTRPRSQASQRAWRSAEGWGKGRSSSSARRVRLPSRSSPRRPPPMDEERLLRIGREIFLAALGLPLENVDTWVIDRLTSILDEYEVHQGQTL